MTCNPPTALETKVTSLPCSLCSAFGTLAGFTISSKYIAGCSFFSNLAPGTPPAELLHLNLLTIRKVTVRAALGFSFYSYNQFTLFYTELPYKWSWDHSWLSVLVEGVDCSTKANNSVNPSPVGSPVKDQERGAEQGRTHGKIDWRAYGHLELSVSLKHPSRSLCWRLWGSLGCLGQQSYLSPAKTPEGTWVTLGCRGEHGLRVTWCSQKRE